MKDIYLEIRPRRREWLGERYFRFNYESDKVVQVCINCGKDVRKGRAHSPGVYLISRLTLLSNYMAMDYVRPISKSTFKKKFKHIVKILQ